MPAAEQTVRILEVDPDLAEHLDADSVAAAREAAVARVHALEPGDWDAEGEYGSADSFLGLFILDGLLIRDTALGGHRSTELLGAGDLLRPWDHDGGYGIPAVETTFTVLEATRIAILDDEFAARIARWPMLVGALVQRVGRRSRWLAVRIAISQLDRTDARVLFLFWHFAERWGRVTPDGVVVPIALTHARVAQLIGAQRPSVTSALSQLARRDLVVRRSDGGWLLHGSAPEALDRMLREEVGRGP